MERRPEFVFSKHRGHSVAIKVADGGFIVTDKNKCSHVFTEFSKVIDFIAENLEIVHEGVSWLEVVYGD